jgi:small-conductance mechanosensitive channel
MITFQIPDWMQQLNSSVVIRQLIIFGLILALSLLIYLLVRRFVRHLIVRLPALNWLARLYTVGRSVIFVGIVWLLIRLAADLTRTLSWENNFLSWLSPLVGLIVLYRFLSALLPPELTPNQAQFWRYQVLLPLILLAVLLQSFGLVETVLGWGLTIPGSVNVTVGGLLTALVIIIGFWYFSNLIKRYLRQTFFPRISVSPALSQALSTLTAYVIGFIGLLMALHTLGIDMTSLAVIAGGLSVGLGFGLQAIVSNFISGFILLFDRSVGPGDVVEIEGHVGIVQSVGVRSIVIKTRDGMDLIVPNANFLTETMTNLTRFDPVTRLGIQVGVSYDSDPRDVEQALLAAANHPKVLDTPPPTVHFVDFAESNLEFELKVWTDDPFQLPGLRSALRYNIWYELKARQIEIPFPQWDLNVHPDGRLSAWMEAIELRQAGRNGDEAGDS